MKNINALDDALNNSDKYFLTKQAKAFKDKIKSHRYESDENKINESDIRLQYDNAFIALKKRSMDRALFPCISCEKLCFQKDCTKICRLKKPLSTDQWQAFQSYTEDNGLAGDYICNYCLLKFRNNVMPPTCILNNLQVKAQSPEICGLNIYEKILIQRAKAFQVIQRMETVGGKRLSKVHMNHKVKGRAFHLPLPLEETLNKICPKEKPLFANRNFIFWCAAYLTKRKSLSGKNWSMLKKFFRLCYS